MRPLSESVAKVAGKSFERKYIALGRIVNNWREIAGEKLADKAQPVKIHYRKKHGEKKPEATLEIAASSSDATVLHYQKDLILERINQIFGERWITAVKFVPIASNTQGKTLKKPKAPLTAAEKKTLSGMVSGIEDGDMRARLENLGKHIIMDKKS